VQEKLGFPYYARDWMQMNRNLFSALKLEKLAMFVILVLIILVASFNIVSTLMMNVVEKEREIAIRNPWIDQPGDHAYLHAARASHRAGRYADRPDARIDSLLRAE
jgi:hypothetical protein